MSEEGSGLSGWAGFMLGQMTADTSRRNAEIAHLFAARLRGETPVDADQLVREIGALRAAIRERDAVIAEKDHYIRQLNLYIDQIKNDHRRLREWANEVQPIVDSSEEMKEEFDKMLENEKELRVDLSVLETKHRELQSRYDKLDDWAYGAEVVLNVLDDPYALTRSKID